MLANRRAGNPFLEYDRPHIGDRVQIRSTGERGTLERECLVMTDDGEMRFALPSDIECECWPDA